MESNKQGQEEGLFSNKRNVLNSIKDIKEFVTTYGAFGTYMDS